MKTLFVRDLHVLEPNTAVDAEFAVKSVTLCAHKNGGHSLTLELADVSGCIPARWWERNNGHCQALQTVRYGRVAGHISIYQQKRSVIVTRIDDIGAPSDLSDYEAVAALPLPELTRRLQAYIKSIRNPHLASLLSLIFGDTGFYGAFADAPAAKSNHHACRHGLLQHTLEVVDIAAAVADVQAAWGYAQSAERDLVVAGALLHDIGKVRELAWDDGCNSYTRQGSLLGHVTLGTNWVSFKMGKVPNFPPLLRDALLHIIVSHHGKPEWGSPVAPMMPEAQIVHAADLLDAQLFYMREAEAEAGEEFVSTWKLDKQKVFVRPETIAPPAAVDADTAPVPAFIPSPKTPRPLLPTLRFRVAGQAASFDTRRLPLIGHVAAGPPLPAEQHWEDQCDVETGGLPPDPQTFLLRVHGDSMAGDGIRDGDIVVVRPQEHHEPEDIVVALLRGSGEAAIKRVEVQDGKVRLVSSNHEFAPIPVPDPQDLQVRGRVVARLRPFADAD